MSIYTSDFWRDLGERVVSTFGQVGAGVLVAAVAAGQGLFDLDWKAGVSVIGIAVLLAVFKGLAAVNLNPDSGASLGTAVPKGHVAAVEAIENEGEYIAEEASPYPEGTPVDVIPEGDSPAEEHVLFADEDAQAYDGEEPDYPAEIDAGVDNPER